MILGQLGDEIVQARSQLVGEVRRGRRDQRLDIVSSWLSHAETLSKKEADSDAARLSLNARQLLPRVAGLV
jgi:hypothetical protein